MALVVWFTALASIVGIFVLFGNMFVIVVVCMQKNFTNFENLLILTLSISDFCVGAFVIPSILTLPLVHIDWGDLFCKLCHHTSYSATTSSVFALCVVAFDRFYSIVFALKARAGKNKTMILLLVVAWVLALLYGLRSSLTTQQFVKEIVQGNTTIRTTSCSVPANKKEVHKSLAILDCIVIFLLPFMIILFCHIAIAWRLCKPTGMIGQESRSGKSQKQKVVFHLLALTSVFLVCHAPLYVIRAYRAMGGAPFEGYGVVIRVATLISFINSAINVFLYATMSNEVKSKMLRFAFWRKTNKVKPDS